MDYAPFSLTLFGGAKYIVGNRGNTALAGGSVALTRKLWVRGIGWALNADQGEEERCRWVSIMRQDGQPDQQVVAAEIGVCSSG